MKRLFLLLFTAACIFGMYWFSPYHQPERAVVELIRPQISDLRDMVVLQGSVTDRTPIRLYADGPAVVREVFVKPGQQVRAGQPLIRLEHTTAEYDPQETVAAAMLPLQQALETGDLAAVSRLTDELISQQESADTGTNKYQVYQLYSPVDCMVMEVRNQKGDIVTGLLPCLVLCDTNNLIIEAHAEEDTVGLLKEEMLCDITIPAFETEVLSGKVEFIMPYARQTGLLGGSPSTKTTLHIALEDAFSLRPGYRAEVKVITNYKCASLLLPYEAVMQDEDGREYVKVLEGNTVVQRYIQTGSELDDQVEILEGIGPQDLLLRSPKTVQEGAIIQYDLNGADSAGT